MLPLEGNRWMATLGGLPRRRRRPGDAEEFLTFAGSLRTSTIYNALRRARRLDGLARYHFTGSVRRHFEKSHAFPRGLLPIADAICRFNPVYGQGMSVAAQEACLLRGFSKHRAKRTIRSPRWRPLFSPTMQALIETPWSVAMFDFVFPTTTGAASGGS